MVAQLALAALLIFLSMAAQVAFIIGAVAGVEKRRAWIERPPRPVRTALALGLVALWLMAAHGAAIWLWAVAFQALGVFEDFETAFYFSSVAFTTLGFGDIIPPLAWRQLAGLCAANGLLMFGVSAAVLVELFREIRAPRGGD